MQTGTTIHHYTFEEKIKSGSVGIVYKGKNKEGKTIAIKQMSIESKTKPGFLKGFKKEFSINQKFKHPNVITMYEYINHASQPFIAMEYFESVDLRYLIKKSFGQIKGHECLILLQIAETLQYIHSEGVTHRDIKPENILVNNHLRIKLIDFSLAQTKWDRMISFGSKPSGTPLYMAPEQIRSKKLDHRCDIYAYGVMAYELFAGHPPFTGASEKVIFQKHLSTQPEELLIEDGPAYLNSMIQKALAKDPDKRFNDMSAFIDELTKWNRKKYSK